MFVKGLMLSLMLAASAPLAAFAQDHNQPAEPCFTARADASGAIQAVMQLAGGAYCQVVVARPFLAIDAPLSPRRGRLLLMPTGFAYAADPKQDGDDAFTIVGLIAAPMGDGAPLPFTLTVVVQIAPAPGDDDKRETASAPDLSTPPDAAKPAGIARME